jgi:predicted nucleic acid-binding protein
VILVDTSVWVDHLRHGEARLVEFLDAGQVLAHPFVTGELALGVLRQRELVLELLHELPQAAVATDEEVLALIARDGLAGSGVGYVDAHLIASARLTPEATLWTRDKRLHSVAAGLELAAAFR